MTDFLIALVVYGSYFLAATLLALLAMFCWLRWQEHVQARTPRPGFLLDRDKERPS